MPRCIDLLPRSGRCMKDNATSPDTGCTLMVIDDNDVDRMMARRMANRCGVVERFLSFESALDALEFLSSEQFQKVDVILLDGRMPKMDGISFLKRMDERCRARLDGTKIFMLTTVISEGEMELAAEFPTVKGFLNKPLSDRQLSELLGERA